MRLIRSCGCGIVRLSCKGLNDENAFRRSICIRNSDGVAVNLRRFVCGVKLIAQQCHIDALELFQGCKIVIEKSQPKYDSDVPFLVWLVMMNINSLVLDVLNVTKQFYPTELLEFSQSGDLLPCANHLDFWRRTHFLWYHLYRDSLKIWEYS